MNSVIGGVRCKRHTWESNKTKPPPPHHHQQGPIQSQPSSTYQPIHLSHQARYVYMESMFSHSSLSYHALCSWLTQWFQVHGEAFTTRFSHYLSTYCNYSTRSCSYHHTPLLVVRSPHTIPPVQQRTQQSPDDTYLTASLHETTIQVSNLVIKHQPIHPTYGEEDHCHTATNEAQPTNRTSLRSTYLLNHPEVLLVCEKSLTAER